LVRSLHQPVDSTVLADSHPLTPFAVYSLINPLVVVFQLFIRRPWHGQSGPGGIMTIRNLIKRIPLAVILVKRFRNARAAATDRAKRRKSGNYNAEVFGDIYANKKWMVAGDSVSGDGSTLSGTVAIRGALPKVARRLGIRSIVDAPCGDFRWMSEIVDCFEGYTGIDIVPELVAENSRRFASDRVSFALADLTVDPLPAADVVLCRDCFIHLPAAQIWSALRNFKKAGYRYAMLTQNDLATEYREIVTGDCRPINWRLPPFSFPKPVETIPENMGDGRLVAVWEMSSLPL